ncbi:unnamed protein product [Alopecurus aequalis]
MEDLPEALVTEILKKITRTSDLNSISLVSKQLYMIEGNQRGAIRVGSGLCTATKALTSFCARFPNLRKVGIDYSGYIPGHGKQLDNKGLFVFSSHCSSLIDLTLSFCSYIDDSGLVGCTSLSALHLIDCEKIDNVEWLEYLGRNGSLEELVVKNCKGINHHDLLKFGSGWMKLQKFEFERKRGIYYLRPGNVVYDSSYDAHNLDIYDFCCESLKDLSCSNLKSISLWLNLQRYSSDISYCETRTSFTDNSLYAIALNCRMLQIVDLSFVGCADDWPSEIGFTQQGFLVLIQSCPIRVLVLNIAYFFDDEGMKALSSSPYLETLELILCVAVTDAGMRFIAHTPCLSNLTLWLCNKVTDVGVAELGHVHKLESLVIECCSKVSLQAAQGVAELVDYSRDFSDALMKTTGMSDFD